MDTKSQSASQYQKVVVIDSGISGLHDFGDSILGGITIAEENGDCFVSDTFEDEIGHGTAVVDILLKTSLKTKIFCIKLFTNQILTTLNKLCFALEYVYENIDCNFIQISGGVTILEDYERLSTVVNKLYDKKIYIISAFDNDGALSYPAAFENVIGVDTSPELCKKEEFELVEGNVIDVCGADTYYRVKWVEPPNIIIKGSSFVTSYITGLIINNAPAYGQYSSKSDILDTLKSSAAKKHDITEYKNIFVGEKFVKEIKKAILFPFNKEIHSIAAFSNLLDFEVVNYYDIKYNHNLGKRVDQIVNYCENDHIVKNYLDIDWESDFDTIICGHCDTLSTMLGNDILDYIIKMCLKHNKKMYAFDNVINYIKDLDKEKLKLFYFPYIDLTNVPQNRFGKLRCSSKPVLGVFGTSSRQGKHTLQLYLRQIFNERNFKVGQIGTEPSGYLFGFDSVYPMGYNSSVFVNTSVAVNVLNEMIWNSEKNNPDIIIVGSQSGTIPYDFGNLSRYTFNQYDFLLGTLPDAFILCVNPTDDIEYIRRTIKFIESLTEAKIIGIVLFPIKTTAGKTGVNITRKILDTSEFDEISKRLTSELSISVYNLLSMDSLNELVDEATGFYSN